MIALDTNVVVRFLVDDDADQSARAAAVVQQARRAGEAVYLGEIVLCETVWVLLRRYRLPGAEVSLVLARLLAADGVMVDDAPAVMRALDALAAGRLDFADALLLHRARERGCGRLYTFDRALLREPGTREP